MYTCVSISNLRGVEDACGSEWRRLNLIVGRNNAGKTTLLEALFLVSGGASPGTVLTLAQLRDPFARASADTVIRPLFRGLNPEEPIVVSATWGQPGIHRLLTIRGQSEADLRISTGTGSVTGWATLAPREEAGNASNGGTGVGSITNAFRTAGLAMEFKVGDSYPEKVQARLEHGLWHLQYPPYAAGFSPSVSALFLSARTFPDSARSAARFSELIRFKRDREVVQAMQLIEPAVQRIEVLSTESEGSSVHVDIGLHTLVPLGVCGEGMVRLFAIAVELISARGGVLLIDEIDNGLHHSVLPGLWSFLAGACRRYDVQLFATTHNEELVLSALDAFAATPGELGLFRIDRRDGHHAITVYDAEMQATVRDRRFEVRG